MSALQLENIIGMDLIPKLYEEWMPLKGNKNKIICLAQGKINPTELPRPHRE